MKKFLLAVVVVVATLGLTGCGGNVPGLGQSSDSKGPADTKEQKFIDYLDENVGGTPEGIDDDDAYAAAKKFCAYVEAGGTYDGALNPANLGLSASTFKPAAMRDIGYGAVGSVCPDQADLVR